MRILLPFLRLLIFYAVSLLMFTLQRLAFILLLPSVYSQFGWGEKLQSLLHGVPMDMSVAAYLTVVPFIFTVVRIWLPQFPERKCDGVYAVVISLLLGAVATADTMLYPYWGFKLDSTPLFYFLSSPATVAGSLPWWQLVGGIAAILLVAALFWAAYYFLWVRFIPMKSEIFGKPRRFIASGISLLAAGLVFIAMRGGVTVSTMNLGRAYFCDSAPLNHAAVNPDFSLLKSLTSSKKSMVIRWYPDAEFAKMQSMLAPKQNNPSDSLLTGGCAMRPDIYVVILESFSSGLLPSLGGENIAENLDSIAKNGLLFTNAYACSFRTDRALPSILNGYPGVPEVSVMKDVRKIERLPSLSGSLAEAGYRTEYFYGGDINFTNMKALLSAGGFSRIVSDRDFPVGERLGKWGAHDDVLFRKVKGEPRPGKQPLFRVIQTSSSHEPFEVPYRKLENPAANAFAFTDSVVGDFLRSLRSRPEWSNTLVVLVPDHYGAYPPRPETLEGRHRVPIVMTGGALALKGEMSRPASQADLAAILLSALGLDHSRFIFSRNPFDPQERAMAYFADRDLAGLVTEKGSAQLNPQSRTVTGEGDAPALLKFWNQALSLDFER